MEWVAALRDRHVVVVEANTVNIQGMRELIKKGFR